MIGKRFGKIVVESLASITSRHERRWLCRCDCGRATYTVTSKLKDRHGCQRCNGKRHGHASRCEGRKQSSTYQIWSTMKKRCTNPACKSFKDYGGRGITVCDRWLESFENFLADMGERPGPGYSIDRKDNDGPYSPDNCRWATRTQQNRNSRTAKLEEHEPTQIRWLLSEGVTGAAIARFFGVSETQISRIRHNKSRVDS
jgi:hypothetical protein